MTNGTTTLEFFLSPGETWEAMYKDCEAAQSSIEFEQYMILDDETGNRFLKLFAEKAKAGVKIRLMLDKVASRSIVSSPYVEEIRKHGGFVCFYNDISWLHIFRPSRWFPRNHIKTMLLDDKIAFTGGVCLGHYMKDWRDTQVRFTGPMVKDVRADFDYCWARRNRLKLPSEYRVEKRTMRYVSHLHPFHPNPIYRELLQRIREAKKSVHLATPYFLPPQRLRRALRHAVRRGVSVRIMMAEKSDVPIADHVAHSYFRRFLRNGIEIFLYHKTVLHAKYAVIDDEWASVGSTNMDYLSLLHNREANVIMEDPVPAGAMRGHFETDLQRCLLVTEEYCRNIPLHHRIIGRMGRMIKKIL